MKTIYLVRHAKTGDAPTDMDRILTVTGIERSHKLGQYLKLMSTKVDIIHASKAQRAIQTAEILAPYVRRKEKDIVYSLDLYLTGEEPYFKILVSLNQKAKTVMFVGHNPDVTNVVRFFIPDFNGYLRTSECYCIDIYTDSWQEIFTAKKEIRFSKLIR
jgi:phosphohistidine phosphatase